MKKSFNFAKLAIPAALAAMLMVPGVSHATCSVGAASALPYVVSAAGGVGTVTLSAPAGCRWTFNARGSAWIRILGPAAGSGSAVVTYQILPNTTGRARSSPFGPIGVSGPEVIPGRTTVTGGSTGFTITVTQNAR